MAVKIYQGFAPKVEINSIVKKYGMVFADYSQKAIYNDSEFLAFYSSSSTPTKIYGITGKLTQEKIDSIENKETITDLKISNKITSIDPDAFDNCTALTALIMPADAAFDEIQNDTCANLTGLVKIVFPHNVTTIGENAFANCESLQSVSFPMLLQTIGTGAFAKAKENDSIINTTYTLTKCYDIYSDDYIDVLDNIDGIIGEDDDAWVENCWKCIRVVNSFFNKTTPQDIIFKATTNEIINKPILGNSDQLNNFLETGTIDKFSFATDTTIADIASTIEIIIDEFNKDGKCIYGSSVENVIQNIYHKNAIFIYGFYKCQKHIPGNFNNPYNIIQCLNVSLKCGFTKAFHLSDFLMPIEFEKMIEVDETSKITFDKEFFLDYLASKYDNIQDQIWKELKDLVDKESAKTIGLPCPVCHRTI